MFPQRDSLGLSHHHLLPEPQLLPLCIVLLLSNYLAVGMMSQKRKPYMTLLKLCYAFQCLCAFRRMAVRSGSCQRLPACILTAFILSSWLYCLWQFLEYGPQALSCPWAFALALFFFSLGTVLITTQHQIICKFLNSCLPVSCLSVSTLGLLCAA